MQKKLLRTASVFVAIGLFMGSVPNQAQSAWIPTPEPNNSNLIRITLADGTGAYSNYSKVQPSVNNMTTDLKCESFDSPSCSGSAFSGVASMLLGICSEIVQDNCIESFEMAGVNGVFEPAKPGKQVSGYRPAGKMFGQYKIPSGDLPSLWVSSVTNSANVGTYVVGVSVRYVISFGVPRAELLDAEIFPVREKVVTGNRPVEWRENTPTPTGLSNGPPGVRASNLIECATVDVDYCTEKVPFTDGTRAKIKVRIPSDLTGWIKGRIKDPIVSSSPINETQISYAIEAEPVNVPQLSALIAKDDPLLEKYRHVGSSAFQMSNGAYTEYRADAQVGLDLVNHTRESALDTSAALNSTWQFTSISGSELRQTQLGDCAGSITGFTGLVSTNAMAYSGGVPRWDGENLRYNVAGMHYLPNGKDLALGYYDLAMRSELARCLYGFSKAPISATVQVVGTGDQNIATTIVSEKDGWLKLAAYGFTFSEKEIKVKLSQPQNKTLTKFTGSTRTLTSKQKAELKTVVTKAKGNPKFICTGVYLNAEDKTTALKRARAACDYAKSIDKNFSFWAQAKPTKAKSYDAKVMIVSK